MSEHDGQDTGMSPEEAERQAKRDFVLPAPIHRLSLGALFMPPIWGAAHGQWPTILFYPLWVFADSMFRTAYYRPSGVTIALAAVMFVLMAGVTIFYALTAQRPAYWRVKDRVSPEKYAHREVIWAITMGIIGIAFIAGATYYNLVMYPHASNFVG